jgi:hypothetical protein
MFDANLRYLPLGREFFAKVHYCEKDSYLHTLGVRTNDIVRGEMLSEEDKNPIVTLKLLSGDVNIDNDIDAWWIVYEGNIDGTGFINESSRKIAMAMLSQQIEE